jgi:hypothetical protein
MSLFEIFITVIFGGASTVIGVLLWLNLSEQREGLKNLKLQHYQVRDEHEEKLNDHASELQKHELELQHSRELAQRSEAEFKELMKLQNQKFDRIIDLFSQAVKK